MREPDLLAPLPDRAVSKSLPDWTHPIAFQLFLLAIFFLPVQLDIPAVKGLVGSRLAPSDPLLVLSVLLAPTSVRLARQPAFMLPVGLIFTLSVGIVLALTVDGSITDHAVLVKFMGGMILAALGLVTASYASQGYGPRILRSFLIGFAFWGLISYLDWKWIDLLSFLDPKVTSRFGGMQFDPNNAGAGFAVATIVSWRWGAYAFRNRIVWLVTTAGLAAAVMLTVSRGGMIGAGLAALVVLAFDRISTQRWIRYIAVAALVVLAAVSLGLVDNAANDIDRRPDTTGERSELQDAALDWFVDSKGVGIGLGTSLDRGEKIVHNTFIWLMVEMSVVGVVFFVAMALLPGIAALRLRSVHRDYALTILGAHVVMVVASMGIEALYQRQWWMIVGLTAWPLVPLRMIPGTKGDPAKRDADDAIELLDRDAPAPEVEPAHV